jgi:hypothetical protein
MKGDALKTRIPLEPGADSWNVMVLYRPTGNTRYTAVSSADKRSYFEFGSQLI